MTISSAAKCALSVTVAAAVLSGCNSSSSQPTVSTLTSSQSAARHSPYPGYDAVPAGFRPSVRPPFHGVVGPSAAGADLYVSAFLSTSILGYTSNRKGQANKKNGPPSCMVNGVSLPNDIDADAKGNLIDPDGGTHTLIIFGPKCGASLGTIADQYGNPDDAVSADAVNGTIAVATIVQNNQNVGSVSLCTLKNGCTTNLTSSSIIGPVASVALNKAGDCWAVSESGSTAALTYFQGCSGSGEAATGFKNTSYGGLDIDKNGDIVSIDFKNSLLYVYSGCNPACSVVGGPFTLHGESIFGHLDKAGNTYASVEFANGQVDIYGYTPTALTYKYSFNNGINQSQDPEGIAYAPSITK